ncbi:MAG: ABC transporter ATP-binding protein [Betaproteobacteria bacterium]|nr:MAG: ABC transporter ATP-binding protein [Betaproteobacteria bacterium]
MAASLLELSSVGKDYAKNDTKASRVRLVLDLLRGRGASNVFRALDDVSFGLAAGESLGVIGENGAGKSTLLKIVAGVITPTRGTVAVAGRVGALLELGSGFHPEYSGLDNIDLAGALLGLSPGEIDAKRESIVAFADIGDHINDPIKHYSSGMVVRLGFAVATALTPDVLITDEVLAVGDESFQKKCIAWMEAYLSDGGTLLFCSHSMYHIQKLCRSALWVKDGRVEQYGAAADVCQAYLAYHEEKSAVSKRLTGIQDPRAAAAAGYYAIKLFEITPGGSIPERSALVATGEAYSPDGRPPVILIGIVRADGTPVYGVATDMDNVAPRKTSNDCYAFEIEFPSLPLLPGKYFIRMHVLDPEGVRMFDTLEKPLVVTGTAREFGLIRIEHRWRVADALHTTASRTTSVL